MKGIRCNRNAAAAVTALSLGLALCACAGTPAGDTRTEVADSGAAKPGGRTSDGAAGSSPEPRAPEDIQVYFMLDRQLTASLGIGDRWVPGPAFTTVRQPGNRATVNARVAGVDRSGRVMYKRLAAEWRPADPDELTVSVDEAGNATITMEGPGQSTLRVTHGAITATLRIHAVYNEPLDATQLELSQEP